MNKISIQKKLLRILYEDKKLSTRAIARLFNCGQRVILRELRAHGIGVRHPNKEIRISKEDLADLYVNKKLSTYTIAKMYNCDSKTIHRKLRQVSIPTRPIVKITIPKEELCRLYHIEKWPLSRIAKKFSCSVGPIFHKMKKYGIASRTMSEAKTIYQKQDFSGDPFEKAYLVGFRLGDLNIIREYKLIRMQTSTTKLEQVSLIQSLFSKYGKLNIINSGGSYHLQIGLNETFEFLVTKKDTIEDWIISDNELFVSFLAGYTDAEGNFGIYKNRLRFRIRTYDKNILSQIHFKLNEIGIRSIFGLASPAGENNQNKDCWGVTVNRQEDIAKLKSLILSYLKHSKRINDLLKIHNSHKLLL